MRLPPIPKSKIVELLELFKKLLVKNKVVMVFLFVFGVSADAVLLESVNSYVFIFLAVVWLLCELVYARKYDWYLTLSTILLFLVVPVKLLGLETAAEKISIWAYFYLVITFIKKLKKSEHKITAC